jgi:hypothetical protein
VSLVKVLRSAKPKRMAEIVGMAVTETAGYIKRGHTICMAGVVMTGSVCSQAHGGFTRLLEIPRLGRPPGGC